MVSWIYGVAFVAVFFTAAVLSAVAGRSARTGIDFSLSGRSLGAVDVSWVIIGTLVGGAATIGTVQMAYARGFAAWYFTLGSGLACLVLGLFFARPLRESGTVTVAEYLGTRFGKPYQVYSSLFSSMGMMMQVVAQYLAAVAILLSVFGCSTGTAVAITFILIASVVISGGMAGAGLIGKLKFWMLCLILALSAGVCLFRTGGIAPLLEELVASEGDLGFFPEGPWAALMDILSMVLGVLSTQIYLQAVFSARTVREARHGALLSAAMIPPLGFLGIVIGLYLRSHSPEPAVNSAQALPAFLTTTYPTPIAAFFLAALLLIVIGTASGLVLGVSTNLYVDVLSRFPRLVHRWESGRLVRLSCFAVLVASVAMVGLGLNTPILQWSYVSMGLRGTAVFAGILLMVCVGERHSIKWVKPILFALPIGYLAVVIHRHL
jgi:SSS family solute:Na+ symporter